LSSKKDIKPIINLSTNSERFHSGTGGGGGVKEVDDPHLFGKMVVKCK